MKTPINFNKVADIYDSYVNADFDISFFLKETEGIKGEILELMCGTGRVSIPLLEQGRKMICVDYSAGMLVEFRDKIAGKCYVVKLVEMDVVNLDLNKKFELIYIPFHSLSEIINPSDQQKALECIHAHLAGNGTFICTLQNPKLRLAGADGTLKELGRFRMEGGRSMIMTYINKLGEDGLVSGSQFYEIYDSKNVLMEKRQLDVCFRPVWYEEFIKMCNKAGYEIVNIYGDYSYAEFDEDKSNYMIFRLMKK